jgi:hypothetical protein
MNAADLAQRFGQTPGQSGQNPVRAVEPKLVPAQGGQALKAKEATKPAEGEDEDLEAEVCFICASPVVHNSVAPCNHRTCHICALRMRALYKTKDCAHCRVSFHSIFLQDEANMT